MLMKTFLSTLVFLTAFAINLHKANAQDANSEHLMTGRMRYNIAKELTRCYNGFLFSNYYVEENNGNIYSFVVELLKNEPTLWQTHFNKKWLDSEKAANYFVSHPDARTKFEDHLKKKHGNSCTFKYETFGASPDEETVKRTAKYGIVYADYVNSALNLNISGAEKDKVSQDVALAFMLIHPAYKDILSNPGDGERDIQDRYFYNLSNTHYEGLNNSCGYNQSCERQRQVISVLEAAFANRYSDQDYLNKYDEFTKYNKMKGRGFKLVNPFDVLNAIGLIFGC